MTELDSQAKTIQSIYAWHAAGKLFVNRRYQRKLVWTLTEKQKLVESVLRGYPIPAVLVAERDGGTYEIIDGLQRLHSLVSFVENAFATIEGDFFDVVRFPTANTRSEAGHFKTSAGGRLISPAETSAYLDYPISVSVMRGATEPEIDDVFGRINTYGHRLSDQERRQAGVQDAFAGLVRELAAELRGDVTQDVLELASMPSISIDMPKTPLGYQVSASDVFWVRHGILTSTDLRDSMDEQCVADLVASIVLGTPMDRAKSALDGVYGADDVVHSAVVAGVSSRTPERLMAEIKYCIDEINKICEIGKPEKLREIIFLDKKTTNPFPAVYTNLVIAFYDALVEGRMVISDYAGAKSAIAGLYEHLLTTKKSTPSVERRKNVESIKGMLRKHLVKSDGSDIYSDPTQIDIENVISRSIVESATYELKQGLVTLGDPRRVDSGVVLKVARSATAIANGGFGSSGFVVIGVADSKADADHIETLDGVRPREVAGRLVVGVNREAAALGETLEAYFSRWREGLSTASVSEPLRTSMLSGLTFHPFHGLGVIVVRVPAQQNVSYCEDKVFIRRGDQTVEVTNPRQVVEVGERFKK